MKLIAKILGNLMVLAISIFSLLYFSTYLYEKPFSYRPSAYLPGGILLLAVAWAFCIYFKYLFNPLNWIRSIVYFFVYFVIVAGVITAVLYLTFFAVVATFGL